MPRKYIPMALHLKSKKLLNLNPNSLKLKTDMQEGKIKVLFTYVFTDNSGFKKRFSASNCYGGMYLITI